MPVTQKQIARKLGLSSQSVRLALSDQVELQKQIRLETRQRILQEVRRSGYVPHHAAHRLARVRSGKDVVRFDQIGLIYVTNGGQYIDSICHAMIDGAEQELSRFHALLMFSLVRQSADWEKIRRFVQSGSADGWLLAGALTVDTVRQLEAWKQPFVILGDHRCTRPVHSVNVDHAAAGRLVAERLAALGHRRIGCVAGSLRFLYQERTLEGFRAAARELALDLDEKLLLCTIDPHTAEVKDWLRGLGRLPTAIFATETGTAPAVFRACQELGLAVPRDISLVECEPAPRETGRPNFTRVELPITNLGNEAVLLLHRVISDPRTRPRERWISPTLIAGWSTSAPPRS